MQKDSVEYKKSGRHFSHDDIRLIQETVKNEFHSGRCSISRTLCKLLGWYSENGKPKEWVCREFLVQLEKEKIIILPPAQPKSFNRLKEKSFASINFVEPQNILSGKLGQFTKPVFSKINTPLENTFWEYLVQKYHYLGYKGVVGRFLKYIVYIDSVPVACIGYCSASLRNSVRDNWFGWDRAKKEELLKHVVNQFRYIIFPWARIKFLASYLISKNIPILIKDWKKQYNVDVFLLETFVEKERFSGISYKAANWSPFGIRACGDIPNILLVR